jgi:hypothetical protein
VAEAVRFELTDGYPVAGFQDRCLKPLGHASCDPIAFDRSQCTAIWRLDVGQTARRSSSTSQPSVTMSISSSSSLSGAPDLRQVAAQVDVEDLVGEADGRMDAREERPLRGA